MWEVICNTYVYKIVYHSQIPSILHCMRQAAAWLAQKLSAKGSKVKAAFDSCFASFFV